MTKGRRVGWQKYEDYIEKQISSPYLNNIIKTLIHNKFKDTLDEEYYEKSDSDLEEHEDDENDEDVKDNSQMLLPITPQLIEDISLMCSFDCWVGHTNFDITKRIKEKLDQADGIEILKIWSRYRFFIGIGQMFNFKEVRNNIENIILKEEIK
jgi:hypothetical protein